MPIICLPMPLRALANGQKKVHVAGETVRHALDDLMAQHPSLRRHVFSEEKNALHSFVKIYIRNEDISSRQGMDTAVEDQDELSIIPAIAGGAG